MSSSSSSSERVEAWRARGERFDFRGRQIHVHRRPGAGGPGNGPTLLLLHGFPSSSFDWRGLLEHETDHAAIAFDFLGFGLSEKPREHLYTLAWQADLTEEIVRAYAGGGDGGGGPVFIVAHDMGTSVATELMARDLAGELELEIAGALLFNGSILLHLAKPTPAQKLLRSRLAPLFARLTSRRAFRHQFGSLFSEAHPLTREEADDQWTLLSACGGHRLGHRLIHYMDERERFTERWHGAFRDWPGELSLAWGMRDPVARREVFDGLRELRPSAPTTELADLGHYPQIEEPGRIAAAVGEALARIEPPVAGPEVSPPSEQGASGQGGEARSTARSDRWASALRYVAQPAHLRRTAATALIVGVILTAINQLDVILGGGATAGVWVKCGLNFVVPFVVSNVGLLSGRG